MITFIYFDIFLLGLIFGSFLNTVIYRLHSKEDFLVGRSTCPHCGHVLAWDDLIPVFSFIFLGGKCRYCRKKISWQYPLVEFITGLLFLGIFHQNINLIFDFLGFGILKLSYLFFVTCSLVIIFVYDLKHYIIPNKVVYPLIVISGLWHLVHFFFFTLDLNQLLNFFVTGFWTAAFFWTVYTLTSGKGMGMGDVKLGFFIGLFLGYPEVLISLFLSFLIGALVSFFLIIFAGKGFKSKVPFGPFLISGLFLILFLGEYLLSLRLFVF